MTERLCACGCGTALGPPAFRKWVSASHYQRAYRRTEAGRADSARRLARRRRRRRQWRAAGLCIRCGAPAAGRARCDRCAALGARNNRAFRDARRRGRRCVRCGAGPLGSGATCAACLQDLRAWQQQRIRRGICPQCGDRRDPEAVGSWCSACRRSERARRRRTRIRRALASFAAGLGRQTDRLRDLRHPGGRGPRY